MPRRRHEAFGTAGRTRLNRLDLLGGLLLTGVGMLMIFVIIPRGTPQGMYYGLPPTFFPTLLSAGLTLSAMGLVIQSIRRLRAGQLGPRVPISGRNLVMFALFAIVIVAGVALIDKVGMILGAPVLIAVLMLMMGDRNPLRIAATATLPIAVVHVLAIYVLQTPTP